ncbi:MAG: hypothetical protein EHM41_15390 [Chloroflexi bacterium]|nr:MAG: hypothetical protein EHM41_15390 [Chloroflexota bacterium]
MAIALILAQVLYWWVFISFFSWLPVWLYPIFTFLVSGITILLVGNLIPGITIEGFGTGIWISLALTAVNAILSSLLSLEMDEKFDRHVTLRMVKQRGTINRTTVPGFLFLEIDGLGEKIFRQALEEGHMPNCKRWLDKETHAILGWETDYTSQTGAMQTGILMGNNDEVPAYRWWDRQTCRIVKSGNPHDAKAIEKRLSSGRGLLSGGGASRGNMYSGDAGESLMTFSTLLDSSRGRGPGFYLYLFNPYVVARLFTRFIIDVLREWWQAWQQRRRKDRYIVKTRNFVYAFFRAFLGPFMQDLVTYAVINDALRGVPAVYALYAGYDDLGHFTGMQSPESIEGLHMIDAYFGRIEKALEYAPRPYHIVVLSDHGQSIGPTFKEDSGQSLEELVKDLTQGDERVYAAMNTNEAWDNVNAFLSESVNADSRAAQVLRTMMQSRVRDGVAAYGPDRSPTETEHEQSLVQEAEIVVMASGCTGLIYFTQAKERMTYEQIQAQYPNLILGLATHSGIGYVLVRSEKDGDMVLGKGGIHFLDNDTVEGQDPLSGYGLHAAMHIKRESSFVTCPDLVVNTRYDPETEELAGFETQVSHHGGLGGPQNHAFIYYPVSLPWDGQPVIGAVNVHRLMRGWRDMLQ